MNLNYKQKFKRALEILSGGSGSAEPFPNIATMSHNVYFTTLIMHNKMIDDTSPNRG